MFILLKTQIKHYLDILLFLAFIVVLAAGILAMNDIDVRSIDVANSIAPSELPSPIPPAPAEPPPQPVYLPQVQR